MPLSGKLPIANPRTLPLHDVLNSMPLPSRRSDPSRKTRFVAVVPSIVALSAVTTGSTVWGRIVITPVDGTRNAILHGYESLHEAFAVSIALRSEPDPESAFESTMNVRNNRIG